MPRKVKSPDPHAERESIKYVRPIASREYILEVVARQKGPVEFDELVGLLDLSDPVDIESLSRRLNAMRRDGQLLQNRRSAYLPVDQNDLIRGRVMGHPDGFGFLIPDEGGGDLFLSPREMRALLHGDRAVVRLVGLDRRGRKEGAVVEVLERGNTRVVGRFFQERGIGRVVADNKRIHQDILIPQEYQAEVVEGQIVIAEIIEQPARRNGPIGRIVEVLGDHMAPGMEIDIALYAHGLPNIWPNEVVAEAAALDSEVSEADKQDRTDLRDIPLVTIDGEDARDFDDAVYCEPVANGWRLLVAIADVSAYVRPGSALDQEAQLRGTSVYFPERVIPMLPEVLSNGLCSLNPGVDRLSLVCEMHISTAGRITKPRFFDAVIRSAARLTYTEVALMVADGNHTLRNKYANIVSRLDDLYALYKAMRKQRVKRGAIDFDTVETRILFGADRKIEKIVPTERNDAHKLIEECMIAANVCAARMLDKYKIPALYRVHEGVKSDKLEDLKAFLAELGLGLGGGDTPTPADYLKLIDQIEGRADRHLIQTVLLRSLSQAVYTPDNNGHFGLAHELYAHFTSPIRRYPDLLVHRAIRHVLHRRKANTFHYSHNDMVSLGQHCSMTERRADEATRDAVDWLKCEYMLDKVGEQFAGVVSSVTAFGLFVELNEIYVEGLVHVTSLHNDYYRFDPAGHRLYGERSGAVYRLGDPIDVLVARVDLDERKIDFALASAGKQMGTKKAGHKTKFLGNKKSAAKKRSADKKSHTSKKRLRKKGR